MARTPFTGVEVFPGGSFGGDVTLTVSGGSVAVEIKHDLDNDVWVSDGGTYADGAHILTPPYGTSVRFTPTGASYNLFSRTFAE